MSIVESTNLEHHYPHALKVKYRQSQHESSLNHVPTFWLRYKETLDNHRQTPFNPLGFGFGA